MIICFSLYWLLLHKLEMRFKMEKKNLLKLLSIYNWSRSHCLHFLALLDVIFWMRCTSVLAVTSIFSVYVWSISFLEATNLTSFMLWSSNHPFETFTDVITGWLTMVEYLCNSVNINNRFKACLITFSNER